MNWNRMKNEAISQTTQPLNCNSKFASYKLDTYTYTTNNSPDDRDFTFSSNLHLAEYLSDIFPKDQDSYFLRRNQGRISKAFLLCSST